MSEILKKIIQSQAIKEGRFYVKDDGEVYEKIITGDDLFTGYYQDAAGTLFTEDGWKLEKGRLFEEFEIKKQEELRLAREERALEVAEKKAALRERVIHRGATKKSYKKLYVGIAAVITMLAILFYGYWERNVEDKNEEEVQVMKEEKIEVPILYGNALVTGDDVNLRDGPSTDTAIIVTLGKRGERVLLIAKDSVVPRWEKVKREDGTSGWIYDVYIKKLDSLDY